MRNLQSQCLPIRDQGRLLACVAFAGTASHELARGDRVALSEAFLHWACKARDGRLPRAGTTMFALDEALAKAGQARAELWPFDQREDLASPVYGPSTEAVADALSRRFGPGEVAAPTADVIVANLDADVAPVLGLRMFRSFHEAAAGALIDLPAGGSSSLGAHAVTVVGYDDAEDIEFLIRNSWGPSWGTAGYSRLSRRYVEAHGIIVWLPKPVDR